MSTGYNSSVSTCSMHPTSDDWYPSFDRGCKEEPQEYPECECRECLAIPSEDKQRHARWEWKAGGRVACFLTVFDTVKIHPDSYEYVAKVSFWGLDDTGYEKYFRYEEDARWFVCHLPPYISQEFLWDDGFITA